MNFQLITLFPEFIESYLSSGVLGRARTQEIFSVQTVNPREFAEGIHRSTDDRPFGGGDGMVMTLPPLVASVRAALAKTPNAKIIALSPQGKPWSETMVSEKLASGCQDFIFISARYAGVDQRLLALFDIEEVSIGDYVLAGGELPALVLMESLVRKLPGTLGHEGSASEDSFARGWLEAPQFTRPPIFENLTVPNLLMSGHHQKIQEARLIVSALITAAKRPDLLANGWNLLSAEQKSRLVRDLEAERWTEAELQPWGLTKDAVNELRQRLADLQGGQGVPSPSRKGRVAMGLVHYPILDKSKNIVATNITNFDIHDIARAARTYGVERYYLIHPMQDQRMFVERVLDHWRVGEGTKFNPSRKQALAAVRTASSLEQAVEDWGVPGAKLVSTHARAVPGAHSISYSGLRSTLEFGNEDVFLIFGTGYGLPDDFMLRCDYLLDPIKGSGKDDFRHLSVRSAVSVILDRLLGAW